MIHLVYIMETLRMEWEFVHKAPNCARKNDKSGQPGQDTFKVVVERTTVLYVCSA